jgi:putative tryptophan/tyrosine transport system substrate-binding protein
VRRGECQVSSDKWIESERDMRKKITVLTLSAMLFALCVPAEAQQPKRTSRIGYLSSVSQTADSYRREAFRQGLYALGYVEGQNIAIEYRYADGELSRFPGLADELIELKVDVIVASSAPGVLAAKKATQSIPIIMTNVGDPVGEGIIDSLARPGANVTGLTGVAADLSGKRLELLKETVPRLARVGVLWDPGSKGIATLFNETETAALAMKVHLQSLEVRYLEDFERAFKAATARQAGAFVVLQSPLTATHRGRVVDFATKSRLPTMFGEGAHVEAGGLMSYAPNYNDLFRRAATFVDKILKGRKPADLPVEQPTKFELVINLKTAKQIGLTIPPNVLVRADKVIK